MMDFRELIKAGVHFGHVKARQCPKMLPYVWGVKNNVQLINVAETAYRVEEAARFLEKLASEGKQILWVGTKKSAQKVIAEVGVNLHMPYVNHRWIGGTLSNYGQVKKSVTKLLHYQDVVARAEKFPFYTKKEINTFAKLVARLKKSVGGIETLTWPIGAIVVVDVTKEYSAVHEASMMGIPVVAIVDTNGDPSLVDYVIPANDDAVKSVEVLINYLGTHVAAGAAVAAKNVSEGKEKAAQGEVAVDETNKDVVEMYIPGFSSEDDLDPVDTRKAKPGRENGVARVNNRSRRPAADEVGKSRGATAGKRRDNNDASREKRTFKKV